MLVFHVKNLIMFLGYMKHILVTASLIFQETWNSLLIFGITHLQAICPVLETLFLTANL